MTGTTTKTRFQTGETCPFNGTFTFDGYLTDDNNNDNTTTNNYDTNAPRSIQLTANETFPTMSNNSCWWKFAQES